MFNKWFLVIAIITILFNISCKKNSTSSENTAPIASFTIDPTSGITETTFTLDASGSTDNEDATSALQVRWDWENDGTFDTDYSTTKTATHQYGTIGIYKVMLEIKDSGGLTNTATITVSINNVIWPLAVGNSWTHEGIFYEIDFTYSVNTSIMGTIEIEGIRWYKLHFEIDDYFLLRNDSEGIWMRQYLDGELEDQELWAKYPVDVGDRFNEYWDGGVLESYTTCTSKNASFESYNNCYVYQRVHTGEDDFYNFSYFKPDIGYLGEESFENGILRWRLVLKSYNLQ